MSKFDEYLKEQERVNSLKEAAKTEAKAEIEKIENQLKELKAKYNANFEPLEEPKEKAKRAPRGTGTGKSNKATPLTDEEIEGYLEGRKEGIVDAQVLKDTYLEAGRRVNSIEKLNKAYDLAKDKTVAGINEALKLVKKE